MKWKVAGALMCMLSLVGCHNDVEKPVSQRRVTVDTPRGKVMLQEAIQNVDDKFVTASVTGGDINATFRLVSTGDDANVIGGRAELLDASGRLLFSIETRMNRVTGEIVMTEATPDDYLTLRTSSDDERVHESYDTNGDVAIFDYPALSDDAERRALNYYRHGLPANRLPGAVSEYIGNLASFETYFAPHANNTLQNNPSGELLVQILTSPELPFLVVGDESEPHIIKWIETTCMGARTCTLLMCRINPAGALCETCWAISVACTILEYMCSWFGC
jgi:hypothetical protein